MCRCLALMLTAMCLVSATQAAENKLRKKVLVFGLDGCRTDAMQAAKATNLKQLIEDGAFSDDTRIFGEQKTWADTVSGPGWSNLLTGVWPDKHGVRNNKFARANYQEFPHFFRRLKDVRPKLNTASFEDWGEIHKRIVSGADQSENLRADKEHYVEPDAKVAAKAGQLLTEGDPDALFVYLGNIDEVGHVKGFHPKVPDYVAEIERVDGHIGAVLTALRSRETFAEEDWLIVVCTDHGGRGTSHGGGHEHPEVYSVFLIVSGPAASRGKIPDATYQVDVAATVATHLGVPINPDWKWDGRAVGLK